MIRCAAIAILTMTCAATHAQSASDNRAQCLGNDPDISIRGCTALIDARDEFPALLTIAYNNRGNAYMSRGQYDRAIADFSAVLKLTPNDAYVFNNRGTAYMSIGDIDRAIEDFTQALRFKPDDADAFYNRGNAYMSKGWWDRAIEDFDTAVQLNPTSARVLFARGMAKQQKMDVAGAAADIAAAKRIDPNVEAKVMKLSSSSTTAAADEEHPPSLPRPIPASQPGTAPPECAVLPSSSTPAYVDASAEQLRKAVPALRGLEFDSKMNGQEQDRAKEILGPTGEAVAAMLHGMPRLSAREEVIPATDPAPDMSDSLPSGDHSGPGGGTSQITKPPADPVKTVFGYRIVPGNDPVFGHVLDEYRVDAGGQRIGGSGDGSEGPHSVGFGITWLIFFPGNFEESRFRYLGREKIGARETLVLAFAQVSGRTHLRTVVDTSSGRCSTLIQGVVWIDAATFHIVRMQTDLLSPLPSIDLRQLRSTVNYSAVKIPQHDPSLWLPSDVVIAWRTASQGGGERHRYSNYKLFEATSTIHYNPSP